MHTGFSNAAAASDSLEHKKNNMFFVLQTLGRPAYITGNKEEEKHAEHGGLFRCQEVCVMVMGLCFEDSPPPPGPVQLHRPKTKKRARSKRAYLCVHTCLCFDLFDSVFHKQPKTRQRRVPFQEL